MREPAVGEFGTGPAFVSNSPNTKKSRNNTQEQIIALRAEFVVKPGKEEKVRETIDLILMNSFGRDREFLQGLVMVSEMESRLVTVITFWHSNGFAEARERRVHWLRQKLTPYLDQSLRVQTFCARVMDSKAASNSTEEEVPEESYSLSCKTFSASVS